MEEIKVRRSGRLSQTFIYLGKLFRMFIFQNDWKVLPMSAFIAGLVCFVVGENLFQTMEGLLMGAFALSCVCVWNGYFNSIQNVCRERPIVKREHRSGLHMSAYIAAHMIYQALLCACQSVIIITVCSFLQVEFPENGFITHWFTVDFWITLFLITYAADMMALFVSSIVHSTTTAMTVMPFLLIFQLVFSGGFFSLSGAALKVTDFTISKWGLTSLCAQGNYNGLPMVSVWNNLVKMKDIELEGQRPLLEILRYIENHDMVGAVEQMSAEQNQNLAYAMTGSNIGNCWLHLIGFALLFAVASVIVLEFIDKDKR